MDTYNIYIYIYWAFKLWPATLRLQLQGLFSRQTSDWFLWWIWLWEEVQRNAKELQWNELVYRHAFPCRQPLFRDNLKHKKQPGSTKEFRRLAIMFTLLQHRTYRAHSMMTDMRCFSGDLPNIRSWNKCKTRNYKSFWALRRKTLTQSTWHNWFECIHIP